MALTARDVMQTAVRTVRPTTRLPELERAFIEGRVGGFPVVDQGRLVGIVSRSDVVRQLCVEQSLAESVSDYYRESVDYPVESPESLEDIAEGVGRRLEQLQVEDVMIRQIITVSPGQPVVEVARVFLRHRIHRAPVTDGDRLVGIISSLDLVRLIADERVA